MNYIVYITVDVITQPGANLLLSHVFARCSVRVAMRCAVRLSLAQTANGEKRRRKEGTMISPEKEEEDEE